MINNIVTVITSFLKLRNYIPGKIHVLDIREELDIVDKESILMEENLFLDIRWKFVCQCLDLYL